MDIVVVRKRYGSEFAYNMYRKAMYEANKEALSGDNWHEVTDKQERKDYLSSMGYEEIKEQPKPKKTKATSEQ